MTAGDHAPTDDDRDAATEAPAADAALGLGGFSFVGLDAKQSAAAFGRYAGALVRRPTAIAARAAAFVSDELRILAGTSDLAPAPKDKRFADEAWSRPGWKRVAQTFVAARDNLMASVDDLDLDEQSADRARFVLMQLIEASAPTNNLLTNPAATRRAVETRGRSLVDGARHLAWDVRNNRGLPSQVDTRPYVLGENMAATPGAVVRRTEQYELIQFAPATDKVRERPLVVIPPQINRYYFLDLAPERSFVEHAVAEGQQVFVLSWRNPAKEHASWSLDTYVNACLDAIEATRSVTDADDVNVIGFCAGGMTQSIMLGYLAAMDRPLVNAATLAVTMIDSEVTSTINMFASERSMESAITKSRRKGVLKGEQLARVFSWVRPNDLIWNYWVSNYLMGENPPAFDVLAWNADATNLPNQIHEQFLRISANNSLLKPEEIAVLGMRIDLRDVNVDHYSVGAVTDHLVPWQSCYQATQLFGGEHRFVLSNSGHIQALVNPPGNPKASYYLGEENLPDPEVWLKGATKHSGSWWTDWAEWITARSGRLVPAPAGLGGAKHPVICDAPGTYVSS